MFDPEVKEPLIKILLFLYKLRVYRKRMVSASHKYHLKKSSFHICGSPVGVLACPQVVSRHHPADFQSAAPTS